MGAPPPLHQFLQRAADFVCSLSLRVCWEPSLAVRVLGSQGIVECVMGGLYGRRCVIGRAVWLSIVVAAISGCAETQCGYCCVAVDDDACAAVHTRLQFPHHVVL